MNAYRVFDKTSGQPVYEYQAEAPLDLQGMGFATHDHVLVTPEPAPQFDVIPAEWRITKLAFRNRFTQAEKVAIEIASLDNLGAPMEQRAQAAALRASNADVEAATYIDLLRPDTRAGVQALEATGLLSQGRAAVILDTKPTDEELYRG